MVASSVLPSIVREKNLDFCTVSKILSLSVSDMEPSNDVAACGLLWYSPTYKPLVYQEL